MIVTKHASDDVFYDFDNTNDSNGPLYISPPSGRKYSYMDGENLIAWNKQGVSLLVLVVEEL